MHETLSLEFSLMLGDQTTVVIFRAHDKVGIGPSSQPLLEPRAWNALHHEE